MKLSFFVDIDQTISTGYVGISLPESMAFYQERGLIIPASVRTYRELFQLPEVARVHEALPGAQEGCRYLAEVGEVYYLTARASQLEEITRAWLREQAFPDPRKVLFCEGLAEKVLAMAAFEGLPVLVDDRWRQVMELLAEYSGRHRVLRSLHERLVIVAFGASQADLADLSVSPPVPIVPLPAWDQVSELLASEEVQRLWSCHLTQPEKEKNR